MASFITLLGLIAVAAAWTAHNCGNYLSCPRSFTCDHLLEVCVAQNEQEKGRLRVIKLTSNQNITILPDINYLLAIQPLELRTYLKISISLCPHISSKPITPTFSKSATSDFNKNEIPNKLQAYSHSTNDSCSFYTFEQIAFVQQFANQAENLLILVNKQPEQSQLSITVIQEKYSNGEILYYFGNVALAITAALSLAIMLWIKWGRKQGQSGSQGQILMEDAIGKQLEYFDLYLPRRRFSQLNVDEKICPICLVGMQPNDPVRQTPCLHVFHLCCLDSWCSNRRICPICRCPLSKSHILSLIDKQEKEEAGISRNPHPLELKDCCRKDILQEML